MKKQQNYITKIDLNAALEANKQDLVSVISKSQEELAAMMAKGFQAVDKRFDRIEVRMDIAEKKIDRALYTDNVNLERRVKNLENKVGI